jgi:3-hydroxybutyryl-CoA dehydrogenase
VAAETAAIAKVGVVGAGSMGAEIAILFVLAGNDVLLGDRSEGQLERACTRLATVVSRGIARGFVGGRGRPGWRTGPAGGP